ncbi:MAG: ferrous iron transport protein B [Pirellulales bacterium]
MNAARTIAVALVGNPNTGKSTLFTALAGVRQRVGNYPGVTVEKKVGRANLSGRAVDLIDLPGTYSLAPRSPDEMVTVDVLLGRQAGTPRPDAVLCVVDASNLERNLYLVSQALDLGLPTVVVLTMVDLAEGRGIRIDVARLESQLGVPVVAVAAHRRMGLDPLRAALLKSILGGRRESVTPFPPEFQREVGDLHTRLTSRNGQTPRFLVERLLLDTSGYIENDLLSADDRATREALSAARSRLAEAGQPVPAVEAIARYGWAANVLNGVVTREASESASLSDRLDRVLCNKVVGVLIFVALMFVMFQSIFTWAAPAMNGIDGVKERLVAWIEGANGQPLMQAGPLRSLITSGVIEGVGGVLIFLPQILILFTFIAVLEDCGYMARAAYLMDKLMAPIGLSGKSFIPLLSSFACAIPGVMAARVIENRRDRLLTILVAPLMSCSARLPVYTLLIAAFIPDTRVAGIFGLQGATMFAMYAIGIVAAVFVTIALRGTILKGETPPFVMELPSYKVPSLRVVVSRVLDRGWAFVRRAGTLIFAVMVLVWAAAYYPRLDDDASRRLAAERETLEAKIVALEEAGEQESPDYAAVSERRDDIANHLSGEQVRHSYLGRAGQWIEPMVEPLGWDWRIGCAAIASFPAREVVVGTMGVLYDLGTEEDEESPSLREKLRTATWDGTDRKVFGVPVALSIMVFFALCCQCAATLAVIKRETNSWRWPAFTFFYMTSLAYVAALATYQIAIRVVAG